MSSWIYFLAAYVLSGWYFGQSANKYMSEDLVTTDADINTKRKSDNEVFQFAELVPRNAEKSNVSYMNTLKTYISIHDENTKENLKVLPNEQLNAPTNEVDDDYLIIEERMSSIAENIFKESKISRFLPFLQENGKFSDLDYNRPGKSEDIRKHARRLGVIVHHEIALNGKLSNYTEASFAFLTYQIPNLKSTNWWWHLIGVPSVMWPAIFKAKSHLNETLKSDFLKRYFSVTKMGPVWNPDKVDGRMSGGNLAPRMVFGAVEYFLKRSLEKFYDQLKTVLYKEVVLRDPWNGNGMRQDGCLHQHNAIIKRKTADGNFTNVILSQVYNNNYGKEFLKNAAIIMWLFDGTRFDLGDKIEEGIFASFFECQQWLYRHTTVEPSTAGRFTDSGRIVTRVGGLDAVARTLKLFQKIDRHRDEVVAALHRYYNPRPNKKFALEGNRHFFVSDLMAHQRQDFIASLRLLSQRTSRPETIATVGKSKKLFNRNPKGYFQGDGFLTILVTGKELGSYRKEVFQVYDWARIPGVTCQYTKYVPEVSTSFPSKKHAYNNADFVGGVTNRKEGLAAMDYARPTVPLRAKKSWFFFDNIIFCLGSGISLPTKYATRSPVTTTLNQIIYEGTHTTGNESHQYKHYLNESTRGKMWTTYDLSGNIWFHHDSTGYVPLVHEGKLVLELDQRTIREHNKNSLISTFSLWLDHGSKPSDAIYAYAILPGQSKAKTRIFARHPTTEVLSLDNSLHAACFRPKKILGTVFFNEGCIHVDTCLNTDVKQICTDQPILMILKDLSQQSLKNEHCPGGLRVLNVSQKLKKNNTKYIKNNEFQPSNLKSAQSPILKFMHRYHANDVLNTRSFILKISVADPTQKLSKLNLRLKGAETFYHIPITLPTSPKKGDSITVCFKVD